MKGRRRLEDESEDVENRLIAAKERQRAIKAKYANRSLPVKEQRELDELEDEERLLARRLRTIQQYRSSLFQKLFYIVRPFEVYNAIIIIIHSFHIYISLVYIRCHIIMRYFSHCCVHFYDNVI